MSLIAAAALVGHCRGAAIGSDNRVTLEGLVLSPDAHKHLAKAARVLIDEALRVLRAQPHMAEGAIEKYIPDPETRAFLGPILNRQGGTTVEMIHALILLPLGTMQLIGIENIMKLSARQITTLAGYHNNPNFPERVEAALREKSD